MMAVDEGDSVDEFDPAAMATGCEPCPPEVRAGLSEYTGKLIEPSEYRSTEAMKPFVPRGKCQSSLPACFPPGTLIRMGDGSQRPIEKVKVTDKVLTAEGNVSTVTMMMVREEKDRVFRLNLWGHRHLLATAEHPILTRRGYVPIAELSADDWVAIPRFMPKANGIVVTAEHLAQWRQLVGRARSATTVVGRQVRSSRVAGRNSATLTYSPIPDVIQLTHGFGRIIGLFLAEGHTKPSSATWTFGYHEKDTLIADLCSLLEKELGVTPRVQKRSNCMNVHIYSTQWAQLFESFCSTGAGEKTLHDELANGPEEFLRGVLVGWEEGDGHGSSSRGGCSVSRKLAMNMFDIANAIGLRPTVHWQDQKINPKFTVKTRRRAYRIKWSNQENRADDWRSELDDKTMFRRVVSVEPEAYSGWVYNMEVEGDHSYVAEGIGVHNCCTYTSLKAYQTKYAYMTGAKYPELSYAAGHQEITGGRMSRGARPVDSIELIASRGIPEVTPNLPEWFKTARTLPADAVANRMSFRADEWEEARTTAQAISGILNNDVVNVCIWWYDSDANPGPTGHLPVRGSGGSGGHSILGCGLVMGYAKSPSGIGILINNHHGDTQTPAMKDERGRTLKFPSWGNDGFGIIPVERLAAGIPDFGCYVLRTVTIRDQDLNVPNPKFSA